VRGASLTCALAVAALAVPAAHAQVSVGDTCPGEQAIGGPGLAYAAYAKGRVHARTSREGKLVRSFRRVNRNGVRTVFGVKSVVLDRLCKPVGYKVQLPIRPNGSTGFLSLRSVKVRPVRTRVEVNLTAHRLTLFRDGERLLMTRIGIGAAYTPTPTGSYYVNQMLRADNPAGVYGPGAIGISAYSPTLRDWEQGGPIAIHGTNAPSSVGRSVSHGCIRVENAVLLRLYRIVRPGSPVVVHA
jgi:lipoprotein-anchoring transpeptidase ErfK/SrfK